MEGGCGHCCLLVVVRGDSNAPRSVAERHRPRGGSSATPSEVGGAGAVEARTTSSVGNTTFAGSSTGESSSLAAAAPLSLWGWAIVVSGGGGVGGAGGAVQPALGRLPGA